jgi:hypothetical protein
LLKKILIGVAVLIVILGIGAHYLGTNLDSIVKSAVEKYGTAATQTHVRLSGVKILVSSGEASLSGLSVGNPQGFATDKSLYLGNISLKLDTASIRGTGPIVIQDVTIEKPQVTYEINNSGESNLQTLARNAQSYAASFSGKEKETAKASGEANKKSGRKIVIDNLIVRDGQITITQAALQGKQLTAKLPLIHLTNIGKSEGGTTPADVSEKILGAITNEAAQVAGNEMAKELRSKLEKAGEDALSGAAGGVGNQIKGLFGK